MSHQDDQDWLDLLAGQSVTHANQKTIHEAKALRTALQIRLDAEQEESGTPYPEVLDKILDRLETDNYKKKPINVKTKLQSTWLTKGRIFFTSIFSKPKRYESTKQDSLATTWFHKPSYAFVVVIIGILVLFVYHSQTNDFVSDPTKFEPKGDEPCVNNLSELQPKLVAENMVKELEALTLNVKLSPIDNGWRVETVLPTTQATYWEKLVNLVLNKPTIEDFFKHYQAADLVTLPNTNYLCIDILSKED